MTRNKKQNKENMPNNKNKEIKQIKELKVKYLSLKESEYGRNHVFAVVDETPLKELLEMTDMKKPIWEYNGKYYLKINAVRINELADGGASADASLEFKKDVPYIMDLTFSKYDFEKNGEQVKGYSISEINKIS